MNFMQLSCQNALKMFFSTDPTVSSSFSKESGKFQYVLLYSLNFWSSFLKIEDSLLNTHGCQTKTEQMAWNRKSIEDPCTDFIHSHFPIPDEQHWASNPKQVVYKPRH
jgi:hypothetical protein